MHALTHISPTSFRRGLLRRCLPTVAVALLGIASALSASATTLSFTALGSQTWTVPANVTSLQIVATGAGGGGGGGAAGGGGGIVTATFAVTPGDTLNLFVGGGGSGLLGSDSGGGGASSNVNTGATPQIIAGGGGGAGSGGTGGTGLGGTGLGGTSGGSGGVGGIASGNGISGGSGNGGSGGNGVGGSSGGVGGGSGSGGQGGAGSNGGGSGGGGGGGFGGGAGGMGNNGAGSGRGGGGGGSTGPAGASYAVAANGGGGGLAGGNGSITITYTAVAPVATASQPVPNLGTLPAVPGISSQLTVLDMSGGSGPSMTTCLLSALKQLFASDATYLGQSANGVVRIAQAGQVISFYPIAATTSTAQGIGIVLGSDGTLTVGTSCGSLTVAPAAGNVPDLGVALTALGLTAQIGAQGVITATVNGTLYAVRPDYFVSKGTATGTPRIAFGTDGVLRFTDSAGNVQILRPGFLDPTGLQSIMAGALGGSLIIQADGSGVFTLINGQQLLLAPEMQLSAAASGLGSANWVNDRANHYLYRIGSYYQGLTAHAPQ